MVFPCLFALSKARTNKIMHSVRSDRCDHLAAEILRIVRRGSFEWGSRYAADSLGFPDNMLLFADLGLTATDMLKTWRLVYKLLEKSL